MRFNKLYLTFLCCLTINCIVLASNTDTTLYACSNISQEIGVPEQAGFTYSWLPITGLSNPDSSFTLFNLSNSINPNVNYTLSVRNSLGALVETHIYRVQIGNTYMFYTDLGADEICPGDTSILISPYLLSEVLTPTPSENSAYFDIDSSYRFWPIDTTTYIFVQADSANCFFEYFAYTVNVKSPIPITLLASDTVFCSSGNDTLQLEYSPMGGIFTGAGIQQSGEFISSNAGGGHHEIVYEIFQGNCSSSASIFLTVIDDAFVRLDALPNYCQKDTLIQLTNGFPAGGTYFIDDMLVTSFNPSELEPGEHIVYYKYSGALDCEVVKSVIFFIIPLPTKPVISASPSSLVCEGDSIQLTTNYFPSYQWSTGDTTQSITVHQSGTFSVTLVGNIGCSIRSDSFSVIVSPSLSISLNSPVFNSGYEISEFEGSDGQVELVIESGGYAPYTVIFNGDTSQSFLYDQLLAGNYYIYIEDSAGCFASDSIVLKEPPFFEESTTSNILPNAMSPNGDGLNDVYIIKDLLTKYQTNTFQVWDIKRQLVYSSTNYANTWDGKDLNGNRLLTGTYFAVLSCPLLNEHFKTFIDIRYE